MESQMYDKFIEIQATLSLLVTQAKELEDLMKKKVSPYHTEDEMFVPITLTDHFLSNVIRVEKNFHVFELTVKNCLGEK